MKPNCCRLRQCGSKSGSKLQSRYYQALIGLTENNSGSLPWCHWTASLALNTHERSVTYFL